MHVRWILACAVALTASTPGLAKAQSPASAPVAGDRERARALANEGFGHFEAGKYEEALKAFEEAERNFHAPTILLMVARSHVQLGHHQEARAVFQRIIDEKLANYAPAEFFEAQQQARTEIAALPPASPGESPGAPTTSPIAPVSEPPSAPGDAQSSGSRSSGSLLPAAIAFGVAGVGVGVGAVTGLMSFGVASDLEKSCDVSGRCPESERATKDKGMTLATVSTVSFVLAGVAAAAGVTLVVLRPGKSSQEPVNVVAGPGWMGVRGRF
ncbi:tetratricopeptide repeat protein [Chondromyces crocatus]|uniref:Tetratricopeptide repeat protein n=1 Tax=Chondromyces crocatus TaxID=52 RepID=A0A0K1EDM8_CHOCO|nr:tetratricopeptide repeat protein [Chondromyces crocatus]AKT38668.1 uncharacterized protein CMC5_028160 [Chondromyces crocatus]